RARISGGRRERDGGGRNIRLETPMKAMAVSAKNRIMTETSELKCRYQTRAAKRDALRARVRQQWIWFRRNISYQAFEHTLHHAFKAGMGGTDLIRRMSFENPLWGAPRSMASCSSHRSSPPGTRETASDIS